MYQLSYNFSPAVVYDTSSRSVLCTTYSNVGFQSYDVVIPAVSYTHCWVCIFECYKCVVFIVARYFCLVLST